jgi:hypothetical protein
VIAARLPWNTFFFFFFKDRATATTGRCRKADGASEFVRNRVAMQAGSDLRVWRIWNVLLDSSSRRIRPARKPIARRNQAQ